AGDALDREMLHQRVEIVVQPLRIARGGDEIAHRVDDDSSCPGLLDLLEHADDDPVDLELDRRRVEQLQSATLRVLDVGPQAPQAASELHRGLLEVGIKARLPASHPFEYEPV